MRGRATLSSPAFPAALLVLAAATGCSLFWDAPSVRIADVRVSGVGLAGATADVTLAIENPNGYSLTSKELRYRLEFEEPEGREPGGADRWVTIAEGESRETVRVRGDDSATVTLAVPFEYRDVGRAVVGLVREGTLRYRLAGDILFDAPVGDVRIPFDDTGHVGL